MAKKVTLADFARNLGINPATARQWKKRGKIVERDGGFELIAEAQKEWLGVRDAGVTGCNCGQQICAICHPYVSVTEIAKGVRILTLERPCDTPEEEAIRTAENLAGLPPSLPLPGLVDVTVVSQSGSVTTVTPCEIDDVVTAEIDPSSWVPGQLYQRSSSGASPERIAELRAKFEAMKVEREAKAAPYCRDCGAWIELQSDWPICKSCHAKNPRVDCGGDLMRVINDLCDRVTALERDNEKLKKDARALYEDSAGDLKRFEALEGRIGALQERIEVLEANSTPPTPDFTSNTGTPPSWLKSSNFSGSRNDLGEPYFD